MVILIVVLPVSAFLFGYNRYISNKQGERMPLQLVLLSALIPIFGPLCVLALRHVHTDESAALQDPRALGGAQVPAGEGETAGNFSPGLAECPSLMPIEEAMLRSDVREQRLLMKTILREGHNDDYLQALQCSLIHQDVEVTHYATVALVELQREYELRIQECEADSLRRPDSPEALQAYIRVLREYIGSGIIEGGILQSYRKQYQRLFRRLCGLSSCTLQDYLFAFQNLCAADNGQDEQIRELLGEMRANWPREERVWILTLRYCHHQKDYAGLRETLQMLLSQPVRFTPEGMTEITLWRNFLPDTAGVKVAAAHE